MPPLRLANMHEVIATDNLEVVKIDLETLYLK